ncbi:MAG: sensor histidine kinase [Vicinamibacteria bacterium]
MDRDLVVDQQLKELAARLTQRRSLVVTAWRERVEADPEITAASALPRNQFNDHIPALLDALVRRLHVSPRQEDRAAEAARKQDSAAHGLLRWQQGYDLREVTREWGHLHLCLLDELEFYEADHPGLMAGVMPVARRAVAELISDGVSESTYQHFALREIEAEGNLRDMEAALGQLRELERRRADLWRQASHDLRNNLGVVANATAGLTVEGLPEPLRGRFTRLLQKSVSSLHAMLDDVMNLARLEAGHERRRIAPFDAAALIGGLCEVRQDLAQERGLYLKVAGPAALAVEGDVVKVQRIAQNLLLNALKYTEEGGVTVTWGAAGADDGERWLLEIADTGPGFHAGPGAPLAGAIEEATQQSQEVEAQAGGPAVLPRAAPDARPVVQERGEGIGLSIVKRLCEMLDAAIELESRPGDGTTIRVLFPRRYDTAGGGPS